MKQIKNKKIQSDADGGKSSLNRQRYIIIDVERHNTLTCITLKNWKAVQKLEIRISDGNPKKYSEQTILQSLY